VGPITKAIDAMRCAEMAMRDHGLVSATECVLCRRMLDSGGTHTTWCPVTGLRDAERRLIEFSAEVAG